MADFNAQSNSLPATSNEQANTSIPGELVSFIGLPSTVYYKMQCVADEGTITWRNTTGDNTSRPACTNPGASRRIYRWVVSA